MQIHCSVAIVLFLGQSSPTANSANRLQGERILQCGPEALSFVVGHLGISDEQDHVRRLLDGRDATSILELQDVAEQLGLATVVVRFADRALPYKMGVPAIIRLGGPLISGREDGHYVVVFDDPPGRWVLVNFPMLVGVISPEKLKQKWDGTALFIARDSLELDALRTDAMRESMRTTLFLSSGCISLLIAVSQLILLLRTWTKTLRSKTSDQSL